MGRYYGSEDLRNPNLQKKAIDYALDKLNPAIHNVGIQTLLINFQQRSDQGKNIKQTGKTSMVELLISKNIYQSLENCI